MKNYTNRIKQSDRNVNLSYVPMEFLLDNSYYLFIRKVGQTD